MSHYEQGPRESVCTFMFYTAVKPYSVVKRFSVFFPKNPLILTILLAVT